MAAPDQCRSDVDWVNTSRGFLFAWGIPVIAMIACSFLDSSIRTGVWVVALIWMGGACMMNARHCNRTHCKFTGPFFLLMAVPVILHGSRTLSFGTSGWWWLGMITFFGSAIIWWVSEAIWGKYRDKNSL